MTWVIGRGNSFIFRQGGGGQKWSTYWSHLISATVENDAPADVVLTFSNSYSVAASDFYIPTKTISSLSSIGNVVTLTLSADVGPNELLEVIFIPVGTSKAITNNIKWWLQGGINPSAVVGAWKAVGVANVNSSLVNLANPGAGTLVITGDVTWDKANGWGGFSATKYITGPVYKSNTYSVVIRFTEASSPAASRAFDAEPDNTGTLGSFIIPNAGNTQGIYRQGNTGLAITDDAAEGVWGMTQSKYFINGGNGVGFDAAPSGTEVEIEFRLGYLTFDTGSHTEYFRGKIQAVAVYNTSLTDAQIIAVENAMKSGSFIVPERNIAVTKYASNPIITYNTNDYNTHHAGPPYINIANKIGSKYYAPAQEGVSSGVFNNITLYESTDLINWTYNSKIISNEDGAWDEAYLLHPSVIKIGVTYYLYYSAKNAANKHQVGIATSTDFLTWTKHPSNPVYSTDGNVGPVCVILIGATYFMYYWNRLTANNGLINYATSPDGVTWTYGGSAMPRIAGEWDYNSAILDPWVIQRSDGAYEMFYTTYRSLDGILQKIGYATSWNGVKWYKHNGAIIEAGASGQWDDGYVGDPIAIDNPITNRVNIFYSGMDNNNNTEHSEEGLTIN